MLVLSEAVLVIVIAGGRDGRRGTPNVIIEFDAARSRFKAAAGSSTSTSRFETVSWILRKVPPIFRGAVDTARDCGKCHPFSEALSTINVPISFSFISVTP